MALNDFFRINLPYGIEKNENNEWTAFNREYLPLGCVAFDSKSRFVFIKYKNLTEKTLLSMAIDNDGIRRDNSGNICRIYFYDDSTCPSCPMKDRELSNEYWDSYFQRLKMLSQFVSEV